MAPNLRLRNNQRAGIQRTGQRISARYAHYQYGSGKQFAAVHAMERGSDAGDSGYSGGTKKTGRGTVKTTREGTCINAS